jgi:hypothetical protein
VTGQNIGFSVEGSNGEWYVDSAERASDVQFSDFAGRRGMWLRNNTQVIRRGVEFADGTVEFDVAPMEKGNFVAVIFRRASGTNHENIYFRVHRSGLYNALQYAPRINASSTWQLYPEFNSTIDLPRNRWTRVRVEIIGPKLAVFINGGKIPVLAVSRLRGPAKTGTVGFWARVNEKPTEWAAALSNVSVRPAPIVASSSSEAPILQAAETLTDWEAVGPFPAATEMKYGAENLKGWKRIEVEENGLVILNRQFAAVRGARTALLRTNINSADARAARLELGYSDEVKIFLNGEPVYQGNNGFESRHPEYMGFVKPGFESVYLRLRPGTNELVIALTDDQRFGWGLTARLLKN